MTADKHWLDQTWEFSTSERGEQLVRKGLPLAGETRDQFLDRITDQLKTEELAFKQQMRDAFDNHIRAIVRDELKGGN